MTAKTEITIAKGIILRAIASGYRVNVWEGEAYAIMRSRNVEAIMEALRSTDYDTVSFHNLDNEYVGSILFTWGEGEDVVCDHTDNFEINRLIG